MLYVLSDWVDIWYCCVICARMWHDIPQWRFAKRTLIISVYHIGYRLWYPGYRLWDTVEAICDGYVANCCSSFHYEVGVLLVTTVIVKYQNVRLCNIPSFQIQIYYIPKASDTHGCNKIWFEWYTKEKIILVERPTKELSWDKLLYNYTVYIRYITLWEWYILHIS